LDPRPGNSNNNKTKQQQQLQQQQTQLNHSHNKVPAVPITPVWTMHTDQLDTWIKSVPGLLSGTNVVLWNNIKTAMNAVKVIDTSSDGDNNDTNTVTTRPDHAASSSGVKQEGAEPPRKRTKKEKQGPILLEDPFQIWLHVTANKNIQR
jgi:hypothetical protein